MVDILSAEPYMLAMIKTILRLVPARLRTKQSVINVIRLQGAISAGGLRSGLNAKDLEPLLQRAFRKGVAGVALAINCPGGSPVQSALIAARIRTLQTHESVMKRIASAGVLDSGGGMNPFTSTIVRHVIESGNLEINIESLKQTFTQRIKIMDEYLRKYIPTAEFSTPHGGYFFWVRIPNVDMAELRKKAGDHQVGLRQGLLFSSNDSLKDYMRLSISFYDENKLEEGILRLKKCFG